jgi:hypothetical protein
MGILDKTMHGVTQNFLDAVHVITGRKSATGLRQLHDLGEPVSGKGIYGHTVQLPPKFGIQLPQAYLWIAPQDLKAERGQLDTYQDSVRAIAHLKDFHGRDGYLYIPNPAECELTLYRAWHAAALLGKNSPKSGWVLGTKEIVHGKEIGSNKITVTNNLVSLKDRMPKESRFVTDDEWPYDRWQFCCTRTARPDQPGGMYKIDMSNGDCSWAPQDDTPSAARPISLEFRR